MSNKVQFAIALGIVQTAYHALKEADGLIGRSIPEGQQGDLAEASMSARRAALQLMMRLLGDIELADQPSDGPSEQLLTLAAFFQDDYSLKLPVVAAFRRWRNGSLTTEAFLKRLGEDDLAPVLHHEPVPPIDGLTILNDYRSRSR